MRQNYRNFVPYIKSIFIDFYLDVCLSHQCAPNARCQAVNHAVSCVCREAFFGNPNDGTRGCQPILEDSACLHDSDCPEAERCLPNAQGTNYSSPLLTKKFIETRCNFRQPYIHVYIFILLLFLSFMYTYTRVGTGIRACTGTCAKTRCGPHALCIGRDHRPECICREGFAGNPADFSIGCQEIRLDTCNTNADCQPFQVGVRITLHIENVFIFYMGSIKFMIF